MPSELSPQQRTLRARLAAHTMHAKHDPVVTTALGRAAFLARFEREVDPEGVLPEAERQRRAEHAKKAYFTKLALASARSRSARNDKGGPKAAVANSTTSAATSPQGGRRDAG